MGGNSLVPTKTSDISVISLDSLGSKSLSFSLGKDSGHCLPFKAVICTVASDLEPRKNQTWDENSIKQNLHLLRQGPVVTRAFKQL